MRNLKDILNSSGKNNTKVQSRRYKSFGHQVLGFGAGGSAAAPYNIEFLVIAGGGSGGGASYGWISGAGAGAGGYRTSTQELQPATEITVSAGDGGAP